ncbi:MAG: hypothetical protein R3B89_20785 [Polyangiaceae bacterium]
MDLVDTVVATPRPRPMSEARSLANAAYRARSSVLEMSARGGCFVGSALSCVDLLVELYFRQLRVDPIDPHWDARDIFLLSKGHAVPALYAVLAERGFLRRERLMTHLEVEGSVYWHPNRDIPGVEFHSGSLGHCLPVGLGIALERARSRDTDRRQSQVFVMLGDGELNEGSVWESLLVAPQLLSNGLTVIVDRNRIQANERTEMLVPLEPLRSKLEAFGWRVVETNGHDFPALERAFELCGERPSVLLAETNRGCGVESLQNRVGGWFVHASPTELELYQRELLASHRAAWGEQE